MADLVRVFSGARHRADRVTLTVPLPRWMWERMAFLLALRGEPRRTWLRRVLHAAVEEELKQLPTQRAWARPRAVAYRRPAGGVIEPLCVLTGGERVWPIEALSDLPAALGSHGFGWRCDISSDSADLTTLLRDVILRHDDIVNAPNTGG